MNILHRNTKACLPAECTKNIPKKQPAAKPRMHSGHVCKCKAFRLKSRIRANRGFAHSRVSECMEVGGEASRMTEVVEQPAWVMQSMEKQALALFSRYESV